MKTFSTKTFLLAFSLAAVAACDDPDADFGAGDVSDRCVGCGIKFNTSWLGSFEFGEFQNEFGAWHKETSVEAVTLYIPTKDTYYTVKLKKVWAENGQIFGSDGEKNYSGYQFKYSAWEFLAVIDGDKTPVRVRVKSMSDVNGKDWKYVFGHNYKATDENGDCYDWSNLPPKDGKEENPKDEPHDDPPPDFDLPMPDDECLVPICEDDPDINGLQYDAIVTENITVDTLTGVIDISAKPGQYWGCTSGAVGKTNDWGYRLEKLGHDVKLLQGGVRQTRADYCGTGESLTKIGTPVSPSDKWGMNAWAATAVKTEAIWGPDGALCIGLPRLASEVGDAADVIKHCEMTGGYIPKKCDASSGYASWADASYWSKVEP